MNKLDVKVGDYIYERGRFGKDIYLYKVDRLTKTRCVSGKLAYMLDSGKKVGSNTWDIQFAYIANDKIIQEYKSQQAFGFVADSIKKLDNDQILKVSELIKSFNKNVEV